MILFFSFRFIIQLIQLALVFVYGVEVAKIRYILYGYPIEPTRSLQRTSFSTALS